MPLGSMQGNNGLWVKDLEKKLFSLQNHPSDQPILNFAERQNLQCELLSIWTNASNEDGLRIIFVCILLLKYHIHMIHAAF